LSAIAQFGRDHGTALAHPLGFTRGKTPAKSCRSDLFRVLDVAALEAALSCWLRARVGDGWDAVALDGKPLRGSAAGDVPGVHLLSAFIPSAGAVLGQL